MKTLLALVLLMSIPSFGFTLFEQKEVAITGKHYFPNGFNPLMPPGSDLSHGINLNLKTNVLEYGYINNMVWSLWDQSQVRFVGWNYQVGIRIAPAISVEYEHFSKHIMDMNYPDKLRGRFPVEDSVNVILYLYRPQGDGKSIFN